MILVKPDRIFCEMLKTTSDNTASWTSVLSRLLQLGQLNPYVKVMNEVVIPFVKGEIFTRRTTWRAHNTDIIWCTTLQDIEPIGHIEGSWLKRLR
jgi:hypothetical protein